VRAYGVTKKIVLDKGSQFTSKFWKKSKLLAYDMALSDLDFSLGLRLQKEVHAKFGTSISPSPLSPGFILVASLGLQSNSMRIQLHSSSSHVWVAKPHISESHSCLTSLSVLRFRPR
jgi:hypothetical protein